MRSTRHLISALLILACSCMSMTPHLSALAQDGAAAATTVEDEKSDLIYFNFKGASFDQVIDFFSRSTGLPVVRETDVPTGPLDYLAPEGYTVDKALEVLNTILQARGVMLRISDDMLYLQKLTEMQRENIPTYVGQIPADVIPNAMVTVVLPLDIAAAPAIAEQLSKMVAEYGSVTAMQQQNSLIITETAAQVRRLMQIVDELDRADPEDTIEIFGIRYARASALMEPLKALMTQRTEKWVTDKQGKVTKTFEDHMPGLAISHDDRTNAIIAKGLRSRIDKLAEAIELLDVRSSSEGRTVRSFTLTQVAPRDAAVKLTELFARVPEEQRPTIVALDEVSKVTIVGSDGDLNEAQALLTEIDGGLEPSSPSQRSIAVVPLLHADPAPLVAAVQTLLNGRQAVATKIIPGPDGRSIVVSGFVDDVAAVKALLPVLDVPVKIDKQIRLMRMTTPDPARTLAKAQALYDEQVDDSDPQWLIDVRLDEASRTLTVIGASSALDRLTTTLRLVESNTVIDRETRQYDLASALPSRIARPLGALAKQMLESHDGVTFIAPTIEPIDELDLLIVTALPEQFATLDSLIATLDKAVPQDFQFRVLTMSGADVPSLMDRTAFVYARMTDGLDPDDVPTPSVEFDELTGNLLLSGGVESVRLYERALAEARRLLPPARSGRMITLQNVDAQHVAVPLRELIDATAPVDPARVVPPPTIEVIERTNSLYIVAETAQHQMIERHVKLLDTFEPADLPPLRLIQVRAADSTQLATMLRKRYDARPPEQRRDMPVTIDADAATNTLIVTTHVDVFQEIKDFVDEVNRSGDTGADHETMIFTLRQARATDLAAALDKLYPQPAMPLDRRGNPLPHLREPKEVNVTADAATNTLIVEAPSERRQQFEALVEQLDRVELPPLAELRTYHIDRGDPAQIARTLTELARQNVMSRQPTDGTKAVAVTFSAEPVSRTLIVAGDEVTFEKTEQMLRDLQAVPIQRTLRVFEITGANPQDLADQALRLYEDQTADMPDAKTVTVEVDRDNATLMVVAEDEAMFQFATILSALQESIGPPPGVSLITLEFAQASNVVTFLEGLLGSELAKVAGRRGPPPTLHAIERTNSVLVAAGPEDHDIIRALVQSLDRPEDQQMPPLRILQLRTADASNLAVALTQQYGQRPAEERQTKPATITADPQTNSLIVAVHPELLPEIQSIVEALNQADRMDSEGREIRIFPLKVARAEELARTIDEMYPQPPVPRDSRGRPRPELQQPPEVVVRADSQTNSLIVDAPIQRMAGFEKLVEQLDRQKLAEETQVRTYPVVHADLDALASTLRDLAANNHLSSGGQDRRVAINISTEPVSNTLIVSGPTDIFDRVEQVLGDLDVRRTGPATSLRFFPLEHARADSIAPMLREVLLIRLREDVPEAGADIESLLNVTSDRKTNTLIISAPEAIMPVIEETINQLDSGATALGDPIIRVKPLIFADAQEVSQALSSALPTVISKATGEPVDVKIIASPGANAIIMVGLESDLAEIEAILEPLDARPSMDAVDARTFKLVYADADIAGPIVERLLTDQYEMDPRLMMERIRRSRGQIDLGPKVRVEADARTNSLIISAPQRTLALADTLVAEIDRPGDEADRVVEVFTPTNAVSAELAATVQRVMAWRGGQGRRSTFEAFADGSTGAIVVSGSRNEVDHALEVLADRDAKTLVPPQMDLQVIALANSDAQVVAQAINPMLRDQSRWPAELLAVARAGVTIGQPQVTADAAANRLLISAPTELMSLARQLISQLDQARNDVAVLDVRIFNLTTADAAQVASAVQSAIDTRAMTDPAAPPVSVAAETSSNSVVVTATPEQLAEIEPIIQSLDSGVALDQPQVRTVFLQHARAEMVVPIVNQLLAPEDKVDVNDLPSWARVQYLDMQRSGGGPVDVRVAADNRLNAVVVSAPPAMLDVAEQMIAQLDIDPRDTAGAVARSVRVLVIDNADAKELASTLTAIFDEDDQIDPPPTIRVDSTSNSLIVRATSAQFEMIEQVTAQVDRATITASRQIQMISIDPTRATAAEMAETLRRMLNRRGESTVEVLTLEQLLRRRDSRSRDAPPGPTSALPARMLDALVLQAFGAVQDSADDDIVRELSDITIAVDPETNSLVVVGSPRAIERIAALVEQLEQQLPAAPSQVRYIGLPNQVDADSMATLLDQTLQRMTPAGGQVGDLRRRVAIVADSNNNALIIACSDIDFVVVGDLIAALSQPATVDEVVVKVYPLETITAERAAESVRQMIAPDAASPRRGRQAQRMRDLAIELLIGDQSIEAVFDPNRVRVSADTHANALIVIGPPAAIGFVDRFVELLDQTPLNVQTTLKLYTLEHAEADEISNTLRSIFRARFESMREQLGRNAIVPEFAVDERTNTLLVTAAPEQLVEVDALLEQLDQKLTEAMHPLRVIELTVALPQQAADILDKVVLGGDQKRRAETLIVADDAIGVLLVRADEQVMAEIDAVLKEIDRRATAQFAVRTIVLERADAESVAGALQRLYDDRARIASSGRGRREQSRRVSIIGDRNSRTVLVAANPEDFAEIEHLIKQFDSSQAAQTLTFRVFELRHAQADEIEQTVTELVNDLTWNQGQQFFSPFFFGFGSSRRSGNDNDRGSVAIRADDRLNALIVTGQGDKFALVESLLEVLDAPPPEGQERVVRLYSIEHADLEVMTEVIESSFVDASTRRWWEPPNPRDLQVRADERTRTLIVTGTAQQQEEVAELVESIDTQIAVAGQVIQVLPVEFAEAGELADTLREFLDDRADATNSPPPSATIVASESANTLIVSANDEDMALLRDLLTRMDQPDVSGDRVIEIVALKDGDPEEIGRIVSQQFEGRGGQGVVVTPDVRTSSLIINAPKQQFARVKALIEQLDAPAHSDETIIRTYALDGAQADAAVRILTETLQLDASGETSGITIRPDDDSPAVEVRAKIVADERSNSLIVTATLESFPIIESLISQLDDVPAASPLEYRIITLEHALALDVWFTVREFSARGADRRTEPRVDYNRAENQIIVQATADDLEQILQIIDQMDQPSLRQRITDFIPLQFAEAEKVQEALGFFYGPGAPGAETPGQRAVQIVADPASNSLVISADKEEWTNVRALLEKLDNEEYDATMQLRVIPLMYADARSVAQAINDAFQGQVQRGRQDEERDNARRNAGPGDGDDQRRDLPVPTRLVGADEWVRAAAEPQTNSVIIAASRQNTHKIELIIEQLDVADFAKLPPPRLIPVLNGSPEQLAESLKQLYDQNTDGRGRKALRIVGDPTSNTVIVRAEEEEFEQIRALALALQQEASSQGLSVHVLHLASAPAARVADAIEQVYQTKAEQTNQPLSIQVDSRANSLVIACTAVMFAEIQQTVDQLDALAPAAGQGVFIIELQNISPDAARRVIETIGLDQEQPDDSVSRLVTEPITVATLEGRNAIIVIANPVDRETIVGLMKAIDSDPTLAEAEMRVVKLRHAEAGALVNIITQILSPGDQQSNTALAQAVQEQVRRLAVQRGGGGLQLDLTKPVRVIADESLNAVVLSSTPDNVEALSQIVRMFDQLPVTEAVTVQLFPLENIAADQFADIVTQLFEQGKELGRLPGTNIEGIPDGSVGRALLDELAIAVDERTNTVIVAGKEESVALVEVLVRRIDADVVNGWLEPRIVPLKYADPTALSETLNAIVVEGTNDLPQANPLQRQVGRLRVARIRQNGGRVLEADVFAPMTRLVIRPEPQLNALVLVGTPMNIEVVSELIAMLDIEEAAPGASVRIYPVEHASAARLAPTLTRMFDEQIQSRLIRDEDRVIAIPDERTNTLIVTTSPRSFRVLERLLGILDAQVAPEFREIHRIELHNASASRLASLIQGMMDARLERLREVEPETADLQQATIVDDPRTNSLIVAAGSESLEVIRRLASDLDTSNLPEIGLIDVLAISTGNVDRIAETIDAIMERRYADMPSEIKQSQQPLVLTDPRTNSLLIAANPEDLTAIQELVARLEAAPTNPAIGLHVVGLEGTRAELLAPRLQQLMRDRQQSLGDAETPSDRVTIEADTASNSLIVAANDENLEIIRGLIEALIVAEAQTIGDTEIAIIQLATSRAADIVDLVDQMYVEKENDARGQNTIQVTADERINAVLVNAPSADIGAIRRLVAQLDGARPATVVEIRYIPLNSANALETVGLIQDVLSGRGITGSGRNSRHATVLRYLRQMSGDVDDVGDDAGDMSNEMEVSAAIRESITLTPDHRTNTVIVSAPRESMDMIVKMIVDLDESTLGSQNIRIFKLSNADSTAMAQILVDLFNLQQQGNLYVLRPRESVGGVSDAIEQPGAAMPYGPLEGTELTAVPDTRQQLSITVDTRTNSLLVSGSPMYLDLVGAVVEELDALEANEREVYVYTLRNAVAGDVARVITEFVETEQQKLIGTIGVDQLGSAARLLEREVTIVGDELSNTVLVSASPRYMDHVKSMIEELDVDPPQVLIQVLMAEVTLDSRDEWGIDFSGSGSIDGVDLTGGFDFASTFVPGLGAPNLAISGSDFDLLLRALSAQGRLQVLSNPSIMAANNQPARLQVGETIRIAESTSFDVGSQQSSVVPEDVGVILEVTPSINPDGFVRMTIVPEISELSSETTQISENFESPIITRRTVTTTITVRDGQTIVVGGLISDRYETREEKVPFFGDIPLIGALFRGEFKESRKTELLIVLTPHVTMSPTELDRVDQITGDEIDRLTVPQRIKDQIRNSVLQGTGGLYDAEGNRLDSTDESRERE